MTASTVSDAGRLSGKRSTNRWLWLMLFIPLIPLIPLDPDWYREGALTVQYERTLFDRPCDPISEGTIIEQCTQVQRWDPVASVSLRFGTYRRDNSGVLSVEASRGPSDSVAAKVNLSDLNDNQWIMIRFDRPLSRGEGSLTIRIVSQGILPGNEVTVWRDSKDAGQSPRLTVNGVGVSGELAMKIWTRKPVTVILREALDRSGPARLIGGKIVSGLLVMIGLIGCFCFFRLFGEVRRI